MEIRWERTISKFYCGSYSKTITKIKLRKENI